MQQSSSLDLKNQWDRPWWWARGRNILTLNYIVMIHALSVCGLVYTGFAGLPEWKVVLTAFGLWWLGSMGTTVAYHRGLSHRALVLNPVVEQVLIFFAVFNGSGSPDTWIQAHRHHHGHTDELDDVSSPVHGGFWWAHLRWLYQWEPVKTELHSDMNKFRYTVWKYIQPPLVVFSVSFGYFLFGWPGLFWLGAFRLVYALHMQCFVNSWTHLGDGTSGHYTQNLWLLGVLQVFCGEHLHDNHHADQSSAKFSRNAWQLDIGWFLARSLEAVRLAKNVRRPRQVHA